VRIVIPVFVRQRRHPASCSVFNNDPSSRNLPKNIPLACTRAPLGRCLGFGIWNSRFRQNEGYEGLDEREKERERERDTLLFSERMRRMNPQPPRIGIRAAPVYLAVVAYCRNTATKGGKARKNEMIELCLIAACCSSSINRTGTRTEFTLLSPIFAGSSSLPPFADNRPEGDLVSRRRRRHGRRCNQEVIFLISSIVIVAKPFTDNRVRD